MSDRAIAMMASEPFVFHGRSLAVFDCFEATPQEAERLTAIRFAVIRQKRYQTADMVPSVEPEIPATPETKLTRKRTYKRRDMKAETH